MGQEQHSKDPIEALPTRQAREQVTKQRLRDALLRESSEDFLDRSVLKSIIRRYNRHGGTRTT